VTFPTRGHAVRGRYQPCSTYQRGLLSYPARRPTLPSLVVFGLLIAWPLGRSVYLSLHGSDLFGDAGRYVGVDNYRDIFTSPRLRQGAVDTALFTLFSVVPGALGALMVLLEARIRGSRLFRTAFALPFAFSVATASAIFAVIYNPAIGIAIGLLSHVGVDRVAWLTDPSIVLPAVCAITVWMNLGYNVLVLSAGVSAIPSEVVEAARLDGAVGLALARRITIPLLSPQLFFLVVISVIYALQSFGQIHISSRAARERPGDRAAVHPARLHGAAVPGPRTQGAPLLSASRSASSLQPTR
jgi:sn-glycerol 3-phosphate transport system permease protein